MMNNEMMRQLQARIRRCRRTLPPDRRGFGRRRRGHASRSPRSAWVPPRPKSSGSRSAPEAVDPEDIETLEDLVVAAVNEALSKAQKLAAEKVAPLTGGMKLPGMP